MPLHNLTPQDIKYLKSLTIVEALASVVSETENKHLVVAFRVGDTMPYYEVWNKIGVHTTSKFISFDEAVVHYNKIT